MKKNIKTIIISGVILLLYPFIGLSEFWEYVYVTIPAFLITYNALRIMKQKNMFSEEPDGTFSRYLRKVVGKPQNHTKVEHTETENRRIDSLRLRNEEHHYE